MGSLRFHLKFSVVALMGAFLAPHLSHASKPHHKYPLDDPYQDPQRHYEEEILSPPEQRTPNPDPHRPNPQIELAFIEPILDAYQKLQEDPEFDTSNPAQDAAALRKLILGRLDYFQRRKRRLTLPHEVALQRLIRIHSPTGFKELFLETIARRIHLLLQEPPQKNAREVSTLFKIGILLASTHFLDQEKNIEERLLHRPRERLLKTSAAVSLSGLLFSEPFVIAAGASGIFLSGLYSTIGYGMVRAFLGIPSLQSHDQLRQDSDGLRLFFLTQIFRSMPQGQASAQLRQTVVDALNRSKFDRIPHILCESAFIKSTPYRNQSAPTQRIRAPEMERPQEAPLNASEEIEITVTAPVHRSEILDD